MFLHFLQVYYLYLYKFNYHIFVIICLVYRVLSKKKKTITFIDLGEFHNFSIQVQFVSFTYLKRGQKNNAEKVCAFLKIASNKVPTIYILRPLSKLFNALTNFVIGPLLLLEKFMLTENKPNPSSHYVCLFI